MKCRSLLNGPILYFDTTGWIGRGVVVGASGVVVAGAAVDDCPNI